MSREVQIILQGGSRHWSQARCRHSSAAVQAGSSPTAEPGAAGGGAGVPGEAGHHGQAQEESGRHSLKHIRQPSSEKEEGSTGTVSARPHSKQDEEEEGT